MAISKLFRYLYRKELVINDVPLAPGVLEGVVIALTREVKPLLRCVHELFEALSFRARRY
jgi:hypothetical protein